MNILKKRNDWEDSDVCKMLTIEDLPYNEPGFKVSIYGSKELQISRYFRRLLTQLQEKDVCDAIFVPSVKELSHFFSCQTGQILKGLEDLTDRGYGFEAQGLYMPIKLWDPLAIENKTTMRDAFKNLLFAISVP